MLIPTKENKEQHIGSGNRIQEHKNHHQIDPWRAAPFVSLILCFVELSPHQQRLSRLEIPSLAPFLQPLPASVFKEEWLIKDGLSTTQRQKKESPNHKVTYGGVLGTSPFVYFTKNCKFNLPIC